MHSSFDMYWEYSLAIKIFLLCFIHFRVIVRLGALVMDILPPLYLVPQNVFSPPSMVAAVIDF